MRRKGNTKAKRELGGALCALRQRELEAVSRYLSASAFCAEEYAELSEMFEGFAYEHAENFKMMESACRDISVMGVRSVRAGVGDLRFCMADECVDFLAKLERDGKLEYERLYLLDESGGLDADVQKILRAFGKRLSILENIMRT